MNDFALGKLKTPSSFSKEKTLCTSDIKGFLGFLLLYKLYNLMTFVSVADPRVMYSEPAKFVAKLREMKTDDNILLFKCELGAGHFSKSGR